MEIPDDDDLYMFVHWKKIRECNYELKEIKKKVPANVFVNKENKGMSTYWSEYSSPEETRKRAVSENQLIEYYAVIGMNVHDIKSIKELTIKYAPLKENEAHTNIFGLPPTYNDKKKNKRLSKNQKKLKVKLRKALSNISIWVLHFSDNNILNRILDPEIINPFDY